MIFSLCILVVVLFLLATTKKRVLTKKVGIKFLGYEYETNYSRYWVTFTLYAKFSVDGSFTYQKNCGTTDKIRTSFDNFYEQGGVRFVQYEVVDLDCDVIETKMIFSNEYTPSALIIKPFNEKIIIR
jgi:hypothetical protein